MTVREAQNGIRDMFLSRHYNGRVPKKDIKIILNSSRWDKFYGKGNTSIAWKTLLGEHAHKDGKYYVWELR